MKDWIEYLDEDEDIDYLVVSRKHNDNCDDGKELEELSEQLARQGFFVVTRTRNCSICKKRVCSKPHY